MFLDFECLIEQHSRFQVLHEWELFFGTYSATFVFLNPENQIHNYQRILLNNSNVEETTVKLLLEYSTNDFYPGVWKLVVFRERKIVGAHRYIVISSSTVPNQSSKLNVTSNGFQIISSSLEKYIEKNLYFFNTNSTVDDYWFIGSHCIDTSDTVSFQCEYSTPLENCENIKWSLNNVIDRYVL